MLILIGPKHCGKSAAGRALAARTGSRFFDIDREIEKNAGISVRALYEKGANLFRAAETAALRTLLTEANGGNIAAAGGGLTDNAAAMALLAAAPVTLVFLRISAAAAWERIQNTAKNGGLPPFLRTENPKETHRALHERRNAACENAASTIIEADGKMPEEIAAEIMGLIALNKFR